MADKFFATCPQFIEDLLALELAECGAQAIKPTVAGVYFAGNRETAYKVCYASRIANRILLPLAECEAATKEEIYNRAMQVPWDEHFTVLNSFVVDCTLKNAFILNSDYAALVLKDAIADFFRQKCGSRPSVNIETPDIRLHLHIENRHVTISLDLSGESLHRRGYRLQGGQASLKENVAAGMLYRAGWPALAKSGHAFMDLMCGSGTLLIEAAFMAAGIPPRIKRTEYGFLHWRLHDPEIWNKIRAGGENQSGKQLPVPIIGYDNDARAVQAALVNCEAAGLAGSIRIERRDLGQADHPSATAFASGLVALNPPYGIRLGEPAALPSLYAQIGAVLLDKFQGWKAAVITADKDLSFSIGLRAVKTNWLYNGQHKCLLSHFQIANDRIFKTYTCPAPLTITEDDVFANRLRKNLRHLGKWARRNGISCYRLYDADIPEYAAAIDFYEQQWLQIQEYAPPETIEPAKAKQRLKHIVDVSREILGLQQEHIFIKQRKAQKGANQYQQLDHTRYFATIRENGFGFKVNFSDYLDTGIFLDNRLLRMHLQTIAAGKHFLNLFSYTGTATVYAMAGGALTATSVDVNPNYHKWAQENLEINGISPKKAEFVAADCLSWIRQDKRKYDLIFLAPPTFSNSKKQGLIFDLQVQHAELIALCMQRLKNQGILIFSVNSRKFKLDPAALANYQIRDLSRMTLPDDFKRKPRMHKCWELK